MKIFLPLIAALALTACGKDHGVAVETVTKTVNVPVKAQCPDPATKAKVDAVRPKPLREQDRPATDEAVRAAEHAQLSLYEKPGAWADQAQAVIDRCFDAPPL